MRRFALAAALPVGVFLAFAGPASAAVLRPTAPAVAPAQIEGFSPYLPQVTCDPVAKPGTLALRTLLLDTYGQRAAGITRACGVGGKSEHKEGRAIDWMLNVNVAADKATAEAFLGWLLEAGPDGAAAYNARRLGVMYVIWNRQVWSSYAAARGWKPYTGPIPHTDHIHISLSWAGAMKQTSFWTGKATPTDYGPCPTYIGVPADPYAAPRTTAVCPAPIPAMNLTGSPLLKRGSTGGYVAQLQALLKIRADGVFGPQTAAALTAYQTAQSLPATGTTDPTTWSRLRSTAAATSPGTRDPGEEVGSATPAPNGQQAATPPTSAATAGPRPSPLAVYAGLTLSRGSRGPAVAAAQKALGLPADGIFGPKTQAAVAAFNRAHQLPADGVIRPATWRALAAVRDSEPR